MCFYTHANTRSSADIGLQAPIAMHGRNFRTEKRATGKWKRNRQEEEGGRAQVAGMGKSQPESTLPSSPKQLSSKDP